MRIVRACFLTLALTLPHVAFAQIPQSEYAARRAALAARLPGDGIVLALGASEPAEDYLIFSQAPSFQYLTGYKGLVFHTKTADALVLPRHAEVVHAEQIWIPS